MAVVNNLRSCLKISYVIFAFCSAFFLGALKGLIVGPIAGITLIAGNVGVILGLFPAHVAWTIYAVAKTNKFDIPLKLAILLALPALFGIWLGLSIAISVLVDVGYGFFTPRNLLLKHSDKTMNPASSSTVLWLIHVPGCIIVGIIGLVVDIPLFTAIAVVKSPYVLIKGWYRLAQDAVNREGAFLELLVFQLLV